VSLEGVEVAQRWRPQDRRPEDEVPGREHRLVSVVRVARREAINEVAERLDAEPAGQKRVERRDRLSMQRRVVGEVGPSRDSAPPGDLEVQPCDRFLGAPPIAATERRREPPRRTSRTVPLADVRDLHASESIGRPTAAGSIVRRSGDVPAADEIDR